MNRLNVLIAKTEKEPQIVCQKQILDMICERQRQEGYDLIVFAGGTFADMLAVRCAVRCGGSAFTRAKILEEGGEAVRVQRGVFSYNLRAECGMGKKPVCVSIEPGLNDAGGTENGETWSPSISGPDTGLRCAGIETRPAENPLQHADLVFVAGRGIGSAEGFRRVEAAAEALGGAAGATRPVASDGWADFGQVIGISGRQISPKVTLVLAASGTMPFMLGIEKSGTIIAVNRDADASIFRACDIGIVSDWQDVIQKIEERIRDIEFETESSN